MKIIKIIYAEICWYNNKYYTKKKRLRSHRKHSSYPLQRPISEWLLTEIIALYLQKHTELTHILCGQNADIRRCYSKWYIQLPLQSH